MDAVTPEEAAALARLPPAIVGEALVKSAVAAERLPPLSAVEVGGTESEVVYAENALEVRRYEPDERHHETPILIVYALVNRPYVLDLQPDRSVVRRLLEAGFVVYLVDWGEPSRLDATLGMADYVDRYLDNCVEAVRADAGARALHVLGYCMGGTMAAIYAARNPGPVRTLSCMAMPFAFDGAGGILERWASGLDPELLVETWGNVPGELLAVEFALLNPVEHLLAKYVRLYENADDEDYVETFARMERWIWDAVDVPGAAFREFVRAFYLENRLAEGTYELGGEPVDLSAIDAPVLLIVGADDDIVPPASTRPFADAVGSDDVRTVEFPVGHVGLSVSSRAHAELWPDVADWLAERSRGADSPSPGDANRAVRRVARQAETRAAASAVADIARRGKARLDGGRIAPADASAGADADGPEDAVETVRGIGPTYGERLRAAGVETVADLRAAAPAELAAIADAPESRAAAWLDRVT